MFGQTKQPPGRGEAAVQRGSEELLRALELAKAGLTQAELAKKMSVPSTTLSDWLREAPPGPADWKRAFESAVNRSCRSQRERGIWRGGLMKILSLQGPATLTTRSGS